MTQNKTFRIYTEDKNKKAVAGIVSKKFAGFTIYTGTGFWQGQQEKSLIIEILGSSRVSKKIKELAQKIKTLNKQQAVLIQEVNNNNYLI